MANLRGVEVTRTSLLDLPYETVLEIVEVGEFDVLSKLALRHTCRRLFQFAGEQAYWMSAARILVRDGLTPPLPPFHGSLTSLSTEQLMLSCVRCHKSNINLRSPSPQYRKHYALKFSPDTSLMENFAFFQGGRFALTTHNDGSACVWDLRSSQTQSESPHDPVQIGDLLATHNVSRNIIAIGYQSSTDPENMTVLVTVACYDASVVHTSLHSFMISFSRHEDGRYGASFSPDYSINNISAFPTPGVIVQDGLAVALVQCSRGTGVILVIVDYGQRSHLTVATGLETWRQWDVVVSGNDFLLFSEVADEVFFAAYFDLRSAIPLHGNVDIQRAPDATHFRTYNSPQSQVMEGLRWYTVHPWDTPHWQTGQLVPVIFEATRWENQEPELEWRSVVGMHWISPRQVVQSLKSGESMPQESRQLKRLRNECVRAWVDDATMLVPSTYGRRLVWVNRHTDPNNPVSETKLEMILLQTPWDTTVVEDAPSAQLNLPLNLNFVHRIDFDDENGQLLVALNPPVSGGQIAHIFTY